MENKRRLQGKLYVELIGYKEHMSLIEDELQVDFVWLLMDNRKQNDTL